MIEDDIIWSQNFIQEKFQLDQILMRGFDVDLIFPHLCASLLKLKAVFLHQKAF